MSQLDEIIDEMHVSLQNPGSITLTEQKAKLLIAGIRDLEMSIVGATSAVTDPIMTEISKRLADPNYAIGKSLDEVMSKFFEEIHFEKSYSDTIREDLVEAGDELASAIASRADNRMASSVNHWIKISRKI
jgi:hypothetical protein